jgi:hypothetical protein
MRKSKKFPVHQLHSLNQGQDNFFMLRKCAQSIPHIKLPLYGLFLVLKIFGPQKPQKCTFLLTLYILLYIS